MMVAVFVVSHPRSGTTLALDFLRRNFPALHQRLYPWESAAELFVNLDVDDWRVRLQRQSSRSNHLLFKSHLAGFTSCADQEAIEELGSPRPIFVYPFRRFSKTIRSFAEFSAFPGSIVDFLDVPDRYFGLDHSILTCVHSHGHCWLDRDPIFLDIDKLLVDPDLAVSRLATRLGLELAPLSRRVPRRKRLFGKPSEVLERLTGRESTEVQIRFRKNWSHPYDAAKVDERFAELYKQLSMRSIN